MHTIHDKGAPHIIIVDEDPVCRSLIRFMLEIEIAGEYLMVCSAEEAIHLLSAKRIDCVITNIKLPGIDGLELAARINALTADIPVIVISGDFDGSQTSPEEVVQGGAYAAFHRNQIGSGLLNAMRALFSVYVKQ